MWRAQQEANDTTLDFEEWVTMHSISAEIDVSNAEDVDRMLLCRRPSQRALRYARLKAFGNHNRVDDESTAAMLTYDSGIASVFQVPAADANDVAVHYVGVLKDILKLDYGPLNNPVVLFRCD